MINVMEIGKGIIQIDEKKYFIEDLPEGLKTKVKYLMETISGLKTIKIDVRNPRNSKFIIPPTERWKTDTYSVNRFGEETQKEFLWLANLLRWFFECCFPYCLSNKNKIFPPDENKCVHHCQFRSGCQLLYFQYHYSAIFRGRGAGCHPFPPESTWLTINFRD
jgi:hypothetical protein